jgi:putative transposase
MNQRRIYDSEGHAQFVIFGCYRRRRLLDHAVMRDAFLSVLVEKLELYQALCCGYVVLPDHLHAILWIPQACGVSAFMKSWKQTSSLQLKKLIQGLVPNYSATISKADPFWQPRYFPFSLYSEAKATEKLNYALESSSRGTG